MKDHYVTTIKETIEDNDLNILYGIALDEKGVKELLGVVKVVLHDLATAACFCEKTRVKHDSFLQSMALIMDMITDKR